MTTQQQAYINGFVKRAADYGYNEAEAISILKQSNFLDTARDYLQNVTDQQTGVLDNLRSRAGDYAQQAGNYLGGLKDQAGDYMSKLKDDATSSAWNAGVAGLGEAGIPSHVADYGLKNLGSNTFKDMLAGAFQNKYDTDMFNANHPLLAQIGAKLKESNIDPANAAAAAGVAGGAGLLGGGYLLGKHLNKKKPAEPQTYNYYQE